MIARAPASEGVDHIEAVEDMLRFDEFRASDFPMSSAIERLSYLVQTLNNSAVELAEQEDLVSMEERLQQKFNALRLISRGHEVKDISQINIDDIVQTEEFEKLLSKVDKLAIQEILCSYIQVSQYQMGYFNYCQRKCALKYRTKSMKW